MKKIIIIAAAVLAVAACKTAPGTGYTLKGNISGLTGRVYLTVFDGHSLVRIDSTDANNGRFTFEGERETPVFATIQTRDGDVARFFLENEKISIQGAVADPAGIKVKGSATDRLYRSIREKTDAMESAAMSSSGMTYEIYDSILTVINGVLTDFIKANPQSVASAFILYSELSFWMEAEEIDAMLAGFDSSVRRSEYYRLLEKMSATMKNTAVGKRFTDVSLPDKDGNTVSLSAMVGEGRYVLLDFWASWCGPCVGEAPNLVAAHKAYAPKGFGIYAVSLDESKADWLEAATGLHFDWINVCDLKGWSGESVTDYAVRSIPANFLIGPDGTIIARNLRGSALDEKLAELMPDTSQPTAGTK